MNQKNRRKNIVNRLLAYGVMTLTVVFGAAFALTWAMGFRVNFKNGEVSQVALMQFSSFPQGANVSINNKQLSAKTPSRINVDLGQKNVVISKNGYRDWKTTVEAQASSVIWLNYVRLVPETVKTTSVKNFANINSAYQMLASPDKSYILLHTSASDRMFTLVDIGDFAKIKFDEIKLDETKLAVLSEGQTEKFNLLEWNSDSRYLLIEHSIFDASGQLSNTEYIELDTQNSSWNGSNSRNITRDFGAPITDPHFAGNGGNAFFARTELNVRKLDYDNKSLSAPLASDVVSYNVYSSNIFTFVSKTADDSGKTKQTVGIYNNEKTITAKIFDDDFQTSAIYMMNRNIGYLAISRKTSEGSEIQIYGQPIENANDFSKITAIKVSTEISANLFNVSPTGRFILISDGNKVFSYDVESDKKYEFTMKSSVKSFIWLDGYHLVDAANNTIEIIDFSGQNCQKITDGYGAAVLSSDGKYIYSFMNEQSDDGKINTKLQASKMINE